MIFICTILCKEMKKLWSKTWKFLSIGLQKAQTLVQTLDKVMVKKSSPCRVALWKRSLICTCARFDNSSKLLSKKITAWREGHFTHKMAQSASRANDDQKLFGIWHSQNIFKVEQKLRAHCWCCSSRATKSTETTTIRDLSSLTHIIPPPMGPGTTALGAPSTHF